MHVSRSTSNTPPILESETTVCSPAIRESPRTSIRDPKRVSPATLNEDDTTACDCADRELPAFSEFRTDNPDPQIPDPLTDTAVTYPKEAESRTDKELLRRANERTDTLLPISHSPALDTIDPILNRSRTVACQFTTR